MTQTAKYGNQGYSSDVETMTITGAEHSWNRQRSGMELKSFIERHVALVGELDAIEYEPAAI